MSQINVNVIKDSNEGAPDFPSGVNVSGITSTVTLGVTNLNPTNVNVSGVVTATTLDGSLLATGTPTLGLGVTINTSGVNISGVATAGIVSATTLYGDGTNLTGIALTIAPLNYNPAVLGSELARTTGIGLTFNQAVKAGSGNVTLSIANAGVAGTVVENFGVGNSVTYGDSDYGTTVTITPSSSLNAQETYHLSYPSGAFTTIGGDVSYVGTAYTFGIKALAYQYWVWGGQGPNSSDAGAGRFGLNQGAQDIRYSSPVQLPGLTWNYVGEGANNATAIKTDATLWVMGGNTKGQLGLNSRTYYSSPVQVPGTTWKEVGSNATNTTAAIKTDGTLWVWGNNEYGVLASGLAHDAHRSSPVQVGSDTNWSFVSMGGNHQVIATKTDGTLWSWGWGEGGSNGQNDNVKYSSPVQIPGTNWGITQDHLLCTSATAVKAIKTDGTLWVWGENIRGDLGLNDRVYRSSPTQVPGTDWSKISDGYRATFAIKTNGTLWSWGQGYAGQLGQNSEAYASSPVQIPGTNWVRVARSVNTAGAGFKTDGTLWMWGLNEHGALGQNDRVAYSSPVQVPGTNWSTELGHAMGGGNVAQSIVALKEV